MEILNDGYWLMPNTVLFNNDLSDKQKLLYCLISSLCAEKWYCRATNEYIWELLNASKITISKNISVLVEKWFIYIEINQNFQRKITLVKNDKGDSQKWQGGLSKTTRGIVENDKIILQDNITNEKKENLKRKWYGEFGKCYLTDKEYEKVINDYWPKNANILINKVDKYCASKGRAYKDYVATIRNFAENAGIEKLKPKQNESGVYENMRENDVYLQNLFQWNK
jgi:hypothetical protein